MTLVGKGIGWIQSGSKFVAKRTLLFHLRYGGADHRMCLGNYLHINSFNGSKAGRRYATWPSNNLGNYRHFSNGRVNLLTKYPILATCDIKYSQILNYHLSSRRQEDAKSLADKTVQILSESKKKEAQKENAKSQDETSDTATPPSDNIEVERAVDASAVDKSDTQLMPEKKRPLYVRAWRRTVKEVKHYYHGFRLLFIDVKICTRYVWGVLNGKTLTRRERKQLVRTTADLFRLVPFMVFIIIPFMEFLLPVALKLFPGLLPSTFKETNKEKEKTKKRLKAKIEIAKFLQDTVEESALVKSGSGKHTELAREFQQFLTEIRDGGITVKTADIMKFTQLFTDDITLDNMTREHLIALSKLLELNTIGTNKMIAFQLRVKLRQLKADDRMIANEGIGSLSDTELQQACRARGMRAIGVPNWRLRYQLRQWLDMHLSDKIPISLLLMSRALYLPETLSKEEQLKSIISTLPENTTAEAEIHAAEVTGEKVDPAVKIKLIRAEEEAIAREKEEEKELVESQVTESKTAEVLSHEEDLQKNVLADKAEPIGDTSRADVVFTETPAPAPADEVTAAPVVAADAEEATTKSDAGIDQELSSQDIEVLEDVLEIIAEEKKIDIDKSSLNALKEDVDEYQEDLSQLKSLVERDAQIIESKSAKRLSSAVNRMIGGLTNVTNDLHRQKQHHLENIEVNQVRMKRSEMLQHDKEALQSLEEEIQKEKDQVISLNELVLAMKRIQKIPDGTRLQKIAEVLDEDKDGQVEISHVLRVLQEIGTENVNIKGSQMTSIIGLLKQEQHLDKKEEEALAKKKQENGNEGSVDAKEQVNAESRPDELK